ncbi:MAG TPA: hypothetical protein VEA59_03185 [Patescibacteria group bacterium]|nr:hypothetical protein [Patescibacteria group bacterium]
MARKSSVGVDLAGLVSLLAVLVFLFPGDGNTEPGEPRPVFRVIFIAAVFGGLFTFLWFGVTVLPAWVFLHKITLCLTGALTVLYMVKAAYNITLNRN